jgi:hypothetical protein
VTSSTRKRLTSPAGEGGVGRALDRRSRPVILFSTIEVSS